MHVPIAIAAKAIIAGIMGFLIAGKAENEYHKSGEERREAEEKRKMTEEERERRRHNG